MRVILATDGSNDARTAGAWLTQLPVPAGSRLRVVCAVSIPPSALDVPPVRDFVSSLRAEAKREVEAARAELAPWFTDSDTQVLEGDARETILRVAEEWPADLIVLGARGLGAVAGFLLGSVSLGVARHARCSVLVVNPAPVSCGASSSRRWLRACRRRRRVRCQAAPGPDDGGAAGRRGAVASVSCNYAGFRERHGAGRHHPDRERTHGGPRAGSGEGGSPFAGVVKKIERQVLVGIRSTCYSGPPPSPTSVWSWSAPVGSGR